MIDSATLRILAKHAPNYHVVSEKFAKDTFSLCVCKDCSQNRVGEFFPKAERKRACRICVRVYDALKTMGENTGLSIVSAYGTCDAAKRIPSNEPKDLVLEGQSLTIPKKELTDDQNVTTDEV